MKQGGIRHIIRLSRPHETKLRVEKMLGRKMVGQLRLC
jgi:hypothetical protein